MLKISKLDYRVMRNDRGFMCMVCNQYDVHFT